MMAFRKWMATLTAAAAMAAVSGGMAVGQQPAAGAQADEQQPRTPRMFRILDTNGDGKITLDEISAEQKRLLQAADLNGDGKLSVDEFRRRGWWFQQLQTTTLFDLMDVNGDGILTAEELAAPSARWFKRYDKDADGSMAVEELPEWQRRRGFRHGGRGR